MRIVVADTGPINYLVLIDAIDLLPKLFNTIFLPVAIHEELGRPGAPPLVRKWAANIPDWIEVRPNPHYTSNDPAEMALDEGERAAIALAAAINADLILIDDRPVRRSLPGAVSP